MIWAKLSRIQVNLMRDQRVDKHETPIAQPRDAEGSGGWGEADLIARLQDGDLTALGMLYEQHKDLVYRTALAVSRDVRAAEDILQECFVRLYKYADSVDTSRPLSPWLYRVTVNLAYDWSAKKQPSVIQPLDEVLEWLADLPSVFPSPAHRAEEKETSRMVREVVDGLPTPHRAVIVLYYSENLSVQEISEVLDLPEGTVKSRLYYARGRLRDMLDKRQRPAPEMTYEFT